LGKINDFLAMPIVIFKPWWSRPSVSSKTALALLHMWIVKWAMQQSAIVSWSHCLIQFPPEFPWKTRQKNLVSLNDKEIWRFMSNVFHGKTWCMNYIGNIVSKKVRCTSALPNSPSGTHVHIIWTEDKSNSAVFMFS
jgi:hypothetical protein